MVTIVIPWPILHFLFILWFSSTLARNLEIPRYETAYACEGKMLKIECKDGELIRLIRANYGRFSITICNDHGNTDWSVNCMSPKSLRVLHNRCSQNQNCSILASTSTFGDPCAGTLKYLEAHYQCMPATTTTTTNRPSPPWLITSQPPSVWSTVKPTTRPSLPRESPLSSSTATPAPAPPVQAPNAAAKTSPSTTSTGATLPQQPVKQSPPPQPVVPIEPVVPSGELTTLLFTTVPPKKHPEESTVSSNYVPSPSTPWSQEEITHYCSPTTVRNLYWNWTRVSERTVQPCPGGATGLARWRCLSGTTAGTGDVSDEPRWYPATPDLSECRSVWLTSLESRVIEGDSLISITSDLSQVTSSKTLYGGDMMITTKIIKKMAQKMSEDIQTFPDQRQREAIVTELLHGVVRTGSNLLDSSQHPSWRDLSYKEQMRVATSLLIGLEENAFLLADTVIREKTVVQTVKNIMLSVRVLETKNIKTETFPSEAVTDKWSASNDWLQLPREALLENSEGGLVRLVFVAFDRLEEILQWQPESALEYTGAQRNLSRVLNSKIISASLGKGRHIQLSQPVRLFLRHLKTDNVSNPSCVFWDYTMSTWSEEGCQVESTNKTHTTCLCDHLTNFAILMDVHATYLPVAHQMALQIITYVGCIISIGCLILTIITFQTFRGLKSDRTTIHKNLCFCLLLAEVLFVVGIGRTSERVLCGVVAGLLHLFFLCAFAWMFLEGFQLYVMLIEVFEAEKSRIRWYYLVAYGIPLFIVTISAIIDPFSYGTEQYCWLRADNFFIFSFVGPVIIVILANIVFLVMAIVMMCRHGNTSVSMKNKEHSRLASASGEEENALRTKLQYHLTWLRGAFVLVFLLGLTWTFGLLFLNKESVVMAYIFTTLNSLQGLFIFVFHCIQNEKVRKEYRKFIRRHSWLPKCLRCMKSRSGSSVLSKERRTSLYGGSNGNTSAPNSHSTDNSGLSPYGTSQYILQRDWSSRSCTTMNRIGNPSVSVSFCATATMVATMSRNHFHHHRPPDDGTAPVVATPTAVVTTAASPPSPSLSPTPSAPPLSQLPHVYDSEMPVNAINTITLPNFRNFDKVNCAATMVNNGNNIVLNPNFPKSISTWGPLHKNLHWKNISFKSYSRDSGHGGSEQEESPRSHMASTTDRDGRLTGGKDCRRQPYMTADINPHIKLPDNLNLSQTAQAELSDYLHAKNEAKQHQLHPHMTNRKKQLPNLAGGGCFLRPAGPWNHTYTEIHDERMGRDHRERERDRDRDRDRDHDRVAMGLGMNEDDADPVYEEIERGGEIHASDMSDEDGKRQSDMSRQSSRSYGDHRPLIPHSPGPGLEHYGPGVPVGDIEHYRMYMYNMYRGAAGHGGHGGHVGHVGHGGHHGHGENARSLAAVLDGETVVCHLEPPEFFSHDLYNARTVVLPPNSES